MLLVLLQLGNGYWTDEVGSALAQPLDSSVYVSRQLMVRGHTGLGKPCADWDKCQWACLVTVVQVGGRTSSSSLFSWNLKGARISLRLRLS